MLYSPRTRGFFIVLKEQNKMQMLKIASALEYLLRMNVVTTTLLPVYKRIKHLHLTFFLILLDCDVSVHGY